MTIGGYIWVTRTQPGADRLTKLLTDHGLRPWCAPVLRIAMFEQWLCESPEQWPAPGYVVLVSRHAAQAYGRALSQTSSPANNAGLPGDAVHIAVGQATAEALQPLLDTYGITAQLPERSDSEGVLALPIWQQLGPKDTVWVLGGVGGRDLLEQRLSARARVTKFALYARVTQKVDSLQPDLIRCIVTASGDGLLSMAQQWREAGGAMDTPLIVPSSRVAQMAMEVGFLRVHNAGSAAPEAALRAIQEVEAI